jgi:hypothetical protein
MGIPVKRPGYNNPIIDKTKARSILSSSSLSKLFGSTRYSATSSPVPAWSLRWIVAFPMQQTQVDFTV